MKGKIIALTPTGASMEMTGECCPVFYGEYEKYMKPFYEPDWITFKVSGVVVDAEAFMKHCLSGYSGFVVENRKVDDV